MKRVIELGVLLVCLAACGGGGGDGHKAETWEWNLPSNFPTPRVPEDNPMSATKVELGRRLFYDKRLARNGEQACATCHQQVFAFTDGLGLAEGSTGQIHLRSSMALMNVAYEKSMLWANPTVMSLEEQATLPIVGEEPIVELGFGGHEDELLDLLRADEDYAVRFDDAFPSEADAVSLATIAKAIASFERTFMSTSSPYDQYIRNEDPEAMSDSALRGMDLFFGEKLECFHCHGNFNFSESVDHQGQVLEEAKFENNGLYNVDGAGAYPEGNQGLYELTNHPEDQGKFKPPSLRNIELTAPYMHDGSIDNLSDVLDHYAAGGRLTASGPNAGDGRANPNKSTFVRGFDLSPAEKADVIAFLQSLTDESFIGNEALSNPFQDD